MTDQNIIDLQVFFIAFPALLLLLCILFQGLPSTKINTRLRKDREADLQSWRELAEKSVIKVHEQLKKGKKL